MALKIDGIVLSQQIIPPVLGHSMISRYIGWGPNTAGIDSWIGQYCQLYEPPAGYTNHRHP